MTPGSECLIGKQQQKTGTNRSPVPTARGGGGKKKKKNEMKRSPPRHTPSPVSTISNLGLCLELVVLYLRHASSSPPPPDRPRLPRPRDHRRLGSTPTSYSAPVLQIPKILCV